MLDKVVSNLFPLRANGRPARSFELIRSNNAFLSSRSKTDYRDQNPNLDILLTCRHLYSAAQNKAYGRIEWEVPEKLGKRSRSLNAQDRCSMILKTLTTDNLRDLQYVRGDVVQLEIFLRTRDVFYQDIAYENLKLATSTFPLNYEGLRRYAFLPHKLRQAVDESCHIVNSWPKVKHFDLLVQPPPHLSRHRGS